jgi:U3 small nucleolar RNA-associated protein 13
MSLKQTDDGLLKVFSVRQTCEPFYSGGKVEVSKDEAKIACLHESNVKLIGLGSSRKITISSLLPEEQDNEDFEEIACFCLNPKNSDEIVVATQKQFLLKHWDLKDTAPVCLRSIKAHKMPILTMDYDPTGTLVATGSADRTVKVWDIVRGYCTHNFTQHIDIVQLVAFHPDPNRLQLFSAAEDNTIRMYDLTSQTCLATFRDHVSLPTHLSFSPDGNVMVSCGLDKVINFYCMQSKELIRTVPCMEELQAVVCLSEDHSSCLLEAALGENGISGNSASNTKKKNSSAALEKKKSSLSSQLKRFVVVTAGEKGVLKSYGVTMKV